MYRIVLVALILVSCFFLFSSPSESQDKKPKGFLSILKEGQSIVLKESAGRYEINLMEGTHKIIEIGPDYIVVEDIAGLIENRIPIYSIKTITKVKLPANPKRG